ncbi:methyl-accepting chemotaxis protein [Rhizobium helianthi]|uniref:Methyl-accepting chemotaxis protein n=1 Tax=Rhizobium helianthi TaxID=1132695 RepID=A0ABW4M3D8_9HYPH
MMIDRMLARFKIQTKVIAFIVPFVVSISAVGLSGLYASSLLQSRMDMSNAVLQSLSGFKDVYSSMGSFLQNTTEQARNDLNQKIATQAALLKSVRDSANSEDGYSDMQSAVTATEAIGGRVNQLWSDYEKEVSVRESLQSNLAILIRSQTDLLSYATSARENLATDEASAKGLLRDAERLNRGANVIAKLVADFNGKTAPDEKMGVLTAQMNDFATAVKDIGEALPAEQQVLATQLSDNMKQIREQMDQGISDATVSSVERIINLMRPFTIRLQGTATLKSRQATEVFGKLDAPIAKATAFLTTTRQIFDAIRAIELKAVHFTTSPDKTKLRELQDALMGLDIPVGALLADPSLSPELHKRADAMLPVLAVMDKEAETLLGIAVKRNAEFEAAGAEIGNIWGRMTAFAAAQRDAAGIERNKANQISVTAMVLGILVAIFAGIGLVFTFKGPILQIAAAMRKLASGDLDTNIDGVSRGDEIGDMARALGIFKENAQAKVRIEVASEQERAAAEEERRRNEQEKQEIDRQIQFAVSELAAGLERLASGDVSSTIDTPFVGRLEQLRLDFNKSTERLQDTIRLIQNNVAAIQSNVRQMSQSTDDLSRRTETQAASLEQTAAAVNEVTSNVRSAAQRAHEAHSIVDDTRRNTDGSLVIVRNAVSAMQRIEAASQKIGQITEVIDAIAFQTNLLALNAGVEAARAGEAGKGFAVVAQEVRELAQRSASAAREIKELIGASTAEVDNGSRLVQETGQALEAIGAQVARINTQVESIALSSRDQSSALQEVNGAVNQMDQLTQQNAAMVEETSAASRQLADEADQLVTLLRQFRVQAEAVEGYEPRRSHAA